MLSLDTLRAWVGSPASDDALLQQLEGFAVARVARHLGIPAETLGTPAARVEVLPGSGTAFLFLPGGEAVGEITEIRELSYPGAAGTVLAADTAYSRRGGRLVRIDGGPWYGHYEYQVTATVGYTEATAPALVKEAILKLVALAYATKGSEDLQSESIGDYSYTRKSASAGRDPVDEILATLGSRIRV